MNAETATSPRIRLKPLLLPAEHGGWGIVGAPVLLGLLIAPSLPGFLIAIGALMVFLARQPLKIFLKDALRRKRFPRTRYAWALSLALLHFAGFSLSAAVKTSAAPILLPLLFLLVLAASQLVFDVRGKGRNRFAELTGAVAASMFAPLIALAGGVAPLGAWLLGLVLALHVTLAIFYVSARLELSRGEAASKISVYCSALLALLITSFLVQEGLARVWIVVGIGVLVCRALWGISEGRLRVRPQVVGFQEVGYTLVAIAAAATGVAL